MKSRQKRLSLTVTISALALAVTFMSTSSLYAQDEDSDTEVSLSAKAKKGIKGAKKVPPKVGAPAVAAVSTSHLKPLFNSPPLPAAALAVDFIARDPNIMSSIDLSAQMAGTRTTQIRQLEGEYKQQQRGSPQALQISENLTKLYEEQAIYLENLRGLSQADQRYPDLTHFIKVTRSTLISQLDQLLAQFPKNPNVIRWKATSLISRIKIGDPSVTKEAIAYAKKMKNGDSIRILLTGVGSDYAAGRSAGSEYGTLENALNMPMDEASKAALKLILAETIEAKDSKRAMALFNEAAKEGQGLRSADGKSGSPITQRAAAKLILTAIGRDANDVNAELVATLQSLGMQNAARFYIEKIALRNAGNQPRKAMTQYADTLTIGGDLPQPVALQVEYRILDIALLSKEIQTIESQWQRIAKIPNALSFPGVEGRVVATQTLTWGAVEKQATPETVERFVRMHDMFASLQPSYAQNEAWTLRAIEGLFRINRNSDVATRGDALANATKKRETQVAAIRFSARARERILGINDEPAFVIGKKLSGGAEVSGAYVASLDKLQTLVAGAEQEKSTFQAAYITHVTGKDADGKARFDAGIQKIPASPYSAKAISYLLDIAQSTRDFAYIEKLARLAESKRITPAKKEHQNLRGIVEIAVFEQANLLASQKQFEPAANKYVAFQKEFSASKNAPIALDLAAKNYLAARKVEFAITTMELHLKQYPTSPYALETRWQAAEQSKGIGQLLRAANHFETFARSHPKEAQPRQAWMKAAEMHKGLGRYANSVADYEAYLNASSSTPERIRVAKEIADMQLKYGKSTEALAAFDRVITLSKNVDDELWARAQMIEIYLRINQEGKVRETVQKVMTLKPGSQDGFKTIAKAKFALARLDARDMREIDPEKAKKLREAVNDLVARFDKTKGLFLSSCEVPGLELCSVGYYETARLAEDVAKKLLEVSYPPTLDPKEVDPIRSTVTKQSERLSNESKSYAQQAETALSTGAPDADYADRIRSYAQQHRGEPGGDAPK